jgi:hypothetical protein
MNVGDFRRGGAPSVVRTLWADKQISTERLATTAFRSFGMISGLAEAALQDWPEFGRQVRLLDASGISQ